MRQRVSNANYYLYAVLVSGAWQASRYACVRFFHPKIVYQRSKMKELCAPLARPCAPAQWCFASLVYGRRFIIRFYWVLSFDARISFAAATQPMTQWCAGGCTNYLECSSSSAQNSCSAAWRRIRSASRSLSYLPSWIPSSAPCRSNHVVKACPSFPRGPPFYAPQS